MLRFIVLGEIPGTHLVITFTWVLATAAICFSAGELSVLYRRQRSQKHSDNEDIAL